MYGTFCEFLHYSVVVCRYVITVGTLTHRAVYNDILSGPWVTLLELVPGSSIIFCLLPCKAWPVDIFYANAHAHILQRSDVAAPWERRVFCGVFPVKPGGLVYRYDNIYMYNYVYII